MTTKRTAVVRTTVEGMHYWEKAPAHRYYLRALHRHLFYVEVSVDVHHNERDIEFHDLLSMVQDTLTPYVHYPNAVFKGVSRVLHNFGQMSCEAIAEKIIQGLRTQCDPLFDGRTITVSVFEDNETGARVISEP